jgi:hypothetical protein
MPLLAANSVLNSSPAVRPSIVLGWAPVSRRFASSWLTRLWRELAVLKRTGRHAKTELSVFFIWEAKKNAQQATSGGHDEGSRYSTWPKERSLH